MNRDFAQWLSKLKTHIQDFKYFVDFKTVKANANVYKKELNLMNSLIGESNIEDKYEELINEYPQVLKCIPILLAVRTREIDVWRGGDNYSKYWFNELRQPINEYKLFMRETGLFDLISHHLINNLFDYVTGVEVGMNTNARKNRTGETMSKIVEGYILAAGYQLNKDYWKEISGDDFMNKTGVNVPSLSKVSSKKASKRFDYVIKKNNKLFGIEVNFYSGGGSKLNETARSYKNIFLETKNLKNFQFVWITDGQGWMEATNNLKETFDISEYVYNINDLELGKLKLI